MADKTEAKKTKDAAAEKKPSKPSMAHTLREVGLKRTYKSREELAAAGIQLMKDRGFTTNTKGKAITPENTVSLLSAMIRDINSERKGVWAGLKVDEKDDGSIRFVSKA